MALTTRQLWAYCTRTYDTYASSWLWCAARVAHLRDARHPCAQFGDCSSASRFERPDARACNPTQESRIRPAQLLEKQSGLSTPALQGSASTTDLPSAPARASLAAVDTRPDSLSTGQAGHELVAAPHTHLLAPLDAGSRFLSPANHQPLATRQADTLSSIAPEEHRALSESSSYTQGARASST